MASRAVPAPLAQIPNALTVLRLALIPVFVPRVGTRHYEVRVDRPIRVPREARDAQVLDRAMREVVRSFESMVREFPSQWFQFAPFWPAAGAVDLSPAPDEASDLPTRARG